MEPMSAEYPRIQMYISGEWIARGQQEITNPATGLSIGAAPIVEPEELQRAVDSAEKGLACWRNTDPMTRCKVLAKASELLRDRVERIAVAVTLEEGKPLAESRLEVLRAASILEWDAHEARRIYGRIIPAAPGMRHLVIPEPVGVVAAFSPWNAPIGSPVRKVAASIAAGCALVLKAAEEAPAGAMLLLEALLDAGLPPHVVNLVFGAPQRTAEFLVSHPSVRLLALTGSVQVGRELASLAGRYMKPCVMELGGHAPAVICEDVDPAAVARAAAKAKFRNAGQLCVAATRFLVHERIAKEFAEAFAAEANQIKVGDGMDPQTQMGPMANGRRVQTMERLIEDLVAGGARVLCGGARLEGQGFFFPPTVVTDVPSSARALSEEPFGPLALVQSFSNINQAIQLANSTSFGLAGYAFTDSASTINRLVSELQVGYVSVNHFTSSVAETPFGGVRDSGYGREGGLEGLQPYTTMKVASIADAAPR